EDALAQQAFEEARRRTREFEDRDRSHREEMEGLESCSFLMKAEITEIGKRRARKGNGNQLL
ncbi:hypothetical protein DV515_00008214, partial [Chloebia gouldiae]